MKTYLLFYNKLLYKIRVSAKDVVEASINDKSVAKIEIKKFINHLRPLGKECVTMYFMKQ